MKDTYSRGPPRYITLHVIEAQCPRACNTHLRLSHFHLQTLNAENVAFCSFCPITAPARIHRQKVALVILTFPQLFRTTCSGSNQDAVKHALSNTTFSLKM